MPATILPFVRPDAAGRGPDPAAAGPEPARIPVLRPHALPTSRQIAHRWAMLSHLRRHPTRPASPTVLPVPPVLP
jgi:hypothetical protein